MAPPGPTPGISQRHFLRCSGDDCRWPSPNCQVQPVRGLPREKNLVLLWSFSSTAGDYFMKHQFPSFQSCPVPSTHSLSRVGEDRPGRQCFRCGESGGPGLRSVWELPPTVTPSAPLGIDGPMLGLPLQPLHLPPCALCSPLFSLCSFPPSSPQLRLYL